MSYQNLLVLEYSFRNTLGMEFGLSAYELDNNWIHYWIETFKTASLLAIRLENWGPSPTMNFTVIKFTGFVQQLSVEQPLRLTLRKWGGQQVTTNQLLVFPQLCDLLLCECATKGVCLRLTKLLTSPSGPAPGGWFKLVLHGTRSWFGVTQLLRPALLLTKISCK